VLLLLTAACATHPPRFREEAMASLQHVQGEGGKTLLPAEFASMLDAFQKGESFSKQKQRAAAERYFSLTLLKGALLEKEILEENARRHEAAAHLVQEQKRVALERRAREETERLAKAREEAEAAIQKEAVEVVRKKTKPQKEPPQVSSHTVKRGESLPLIASQPEVYGDRNLWPLIYRANRDQIRDPRQIWPGQVLRVPRNLGRDDFSEARHYAQERPLR